MFIFFFSSRRRHTRCYRDWSSDVCSSDLVLQQEARPEPGLVTGDARNRLDAHDASSTVCAAELNCHITGSGGVTLVRPCADSSITGRPPTASVVLTPAVMDVTFRQGVCPAWALVLEQFETLAASKSACTSTGEPPAVSDRVEAWTTTVPPCAHLIFESVVSTAGITTPPRTCRRA